MEVTTLLPQDVRNLLSLHSLGIQYAHGVFYIFPEVEGYDSNRRRAVSLDWLAPIEHWNREVDMWEQLYGTRL